MEKPKPILWLSDAEKNRGKVMDYILNENININVNVNVDSMTPEEIKEFDKFYNDRYERYYAQKIKTRSIRIKTIP